ncbi:unnamed protein product [Amaranthus hypochondriacus]
MAGTGRGGRGSRGGGRTSGAQTRSTSDLASEEDENSSNCRSGQDVEAPNDKGEEESPQEDGNTRQLQGLRAQFDQLRDLLENLEGGKQKLPSEEQPVPISNPNTTASWKEKVQPKLSQKDRQKLNETTKKGDGKGMEETQKKDTNTQLQTATVQNQLHEDQTAAGHIKPPESSSNAREISGEGDWTEVKNRKTTKKNKNGSTTPTQGEIVMLEATPERGGIPVNPSGSQ